MQMPKMTKIQAHFEDSNLELNLQKDENGHYLNEVARYAFMNWMTAYSLGREHQVKIANKAIEIALAEQSQEQSDSGGWIANKGTQPVTDEVEVEFRMRSEVKSCDAASNLRWDFEKNLGGDITHWRLAKQISWKHLPLGVAVRDKATGVIWLYMGSTELEAVLVNIPSRPFGSRFIELTALELAPPSEQPLIPTIAPAEGLIVEHSKFDECMRITGIAKGWKLK